MDTTSTASNHIQRSQFLKQYYATQHTKTVKRLMEYGLLDPQPYQTDRWYIGDDHEGTIRKYYQAVYCGESCFVKLAQNDSTICNEIFVNQYATKHSLAFVPQTLLCDMAYDIDTSLLVTQFRANLRKFTIPEDIVQFERYCMNFLDIHCEMEKYEMVHGDISDSNLLLDDSQQMVLTDFGIGRVTGAEKYMIDYIAHDGNYYINKGNMRIYDDAYSYIQMLEACGIPLNFKEIRAYRCIFERIGTMQYNVYLPKQY